MANHLQSPSTKSTTPATCSDRDFKRGSQIFAALEAAYGNKFTSGFNSEKAMKKGIEIWGTQTSFLTGKELAYGLQQAIILSEWNPTLAEFIRLSLGLPSLEQAIARILNLKLSDPVTMEIGRSIGSWDLGRQSQSVIIKRVTGCYPDAYVRVLDDIKKSRLRH